jgi:hypothetical protein
MLHEEEQKRLAIERQIDGIVDRMAVSEADRERMAGMLRYMNLGPGRGQQWNAEQYAQQSGDALADVMRCYRLLQNCSQVTADNVRDLFARGAAGRAALERRWKKSGYTDLDAQRGLLIFERPQMSPALFAGLWQLLERQLPREKPPYHGLRWLLVKDALAHNPNMKVREASEEASKRAAHTAAHGSAGTIERSYYIFEKQQARRRPPRRARST